MRYDILILGGGAAAQQAAREAARLGRRVALVAPAAPWDAEPGDPAIDVLPPGDALLRLADQYGEQGNTGTISTADFRRDLIHILREETEIVRQHLEWSGVNVLCGDARFLGEQTVEIENPGNYWVLDADHMLIATGTETHRPEHLPFDGRQLFTTDDLLALDDIPDELLVVGAAAPGLRAAIAFAQFGSRVTVVDRRSELELAGALPALLEDARVAGVAFEPGREVIGVEPTDADGVALLLQDGGRRYGRSALWNAGRVGRTGNLNLQAIGVETDERGRLWCNKRLQTWASHVYGAGDVVGFPPVAADEAEQGLQAVRQMFGDEPVPAKNTVERTADLIGAAL